MCGLGLKNSTVGIVGFGRIGQEVAKLLLPFGISEILYTARSEKPEGQALHATFTTLENLATCSDFVIVCCALNEKTKKLFHKDIFNKMKPTSIFINVSRGGENSYSNH